MSTDHAGELSPTLPGDGPDDRADQVTVTRSEEQLRVSTTVHAVGRVRVRKVVVTEERTLTVRVQREELRVEDETFDGGDAVRHELGTAEPVELVLHEQRPVIGYETVPVERVRIGTRVVSEHRTVRADVGVEVVETPTSDQRS